MITNNKIKRLQRRRKLRRQRSAFFGIMLVFILMMAHGAFSKPGNIGSEYDVVSVKVMPGDTLWSIAKEYKAEGQDLRKFVYDLAANNGLSDCCVKSGQTIFVPVAK